MKFVLCEMCACPSPEGYVCLCGGKGKYVKSVAMGDVIAHVRESILPIGELPIEGVVEKLKEAFDNVGFKYDVSELSDLILQIKGANKSDVEKFTYALSMYVLCIDYGIKTVKAVDSDSVRRWAQSNRDHALSLLQALQTSNIIAMLQKYGIRVIEL